MAQSELTERICQPGREGSWHNTHARWHSGSIEELDHPSNSVSRLPADAVRLNRPSGSRICRQGRQHRALSKQCIAFRVAWNAQTVRQQRFDGVSEMLLEPPDQLQGESHNSIL